MFPIFFSVIAAVLVIPYLIYLSHFSSHLSVKSQENLARVMVEHNALVRRYCILQESDSVPCAQDDTFRDLASRGASGTPIEDVKGIYPSALANSDFVKNGFITSVYREVTGKGGDKTGFVITYLTRSKLDKLKPGMVAKALVQTQRDYYSGYYSDVNDCVMGIGDPTKTMDTQGKPLIDKDDCTNLLWGLTLNGDSLYDGVPLIIHKLHDPN